MILPEFGFLCSRLRIEGHKLRVVEDGLVFEDLEAADDQVVDLDQIGD